MGWLLEKIRIQNFLFLRILFEILFVFAFLPVDIPHNEIKTAMLQGLLFIAACRKHYD